MKSFDPEGILQ